MATVAVSLRTESGDDYLSMYTGVTSPQDFASRVAQEMGEELAYVYTQSVVCDDGRESDYNRALHAAREEAQEWN